MGSASHAFNHTYTHQYCFGQQLINSSQNICFSWTVATVFYLSFDTSVRLWIYPMFSFLSKTLLFHLKLLSGCQKILIKGVVLWSIVRRQERIQMSSPIESSLLSFSLSLQIEFFRFLTLFLALYFDFAVNWVTYSYIHIYKSGYDF